MQQNVPVGQVSTGEVNGDRSALARVQLHAEEGLELAYATVDGSVGKSQVHLWDGGTSAVAGIGDGEADGEHRLVLSSFVGDRPDE